MTTANSTPTLHKPDAPRKTVKQKPIEDALKLAYRIQIGDLSISPADAIESLESALMLVMGVERYDQWCVEGNPKP